MLTGSALAGLVGSVGAFETARKTGPVAVRSARPADGTAGTVGVDLTWRVRTGRREVALTFDDGPDPEWTPQVLAMLKRHRAKATFFVIGRHVERHPELVRRAVGEGHEIGNHTWSHAHLDRCNAGKVREQLERGSAAIAAVTGVRPTLFRPPRGIIGPVGLLAAAEAGQPIVLWSTLIRGKSPWRDLAQVVASITPGSIVLGHDGGPTPRQELMMAFDQLLRRLSDDGYRFVTVSALRAAAPAETALLSALDRRAPASLHRHQLPLWATFSVL